MTDERIVELYWQRDEEAIRLTSQKYEAYLMKIALNIVADREDSGECVNDTYMRAWNAMPPHRPAALSTFLGKITRRLSIDRLRRKHSLKRRPEQYTMSLSELGDSFASTDTPEQLTDAQALGEAIGRFLRTLPEETRNAFICRYYFFDQLGDIAAYLGISQSRLKGLLFRARSGLREYLIKEGFEL